MKLDYILISLAIASLSDAAPIKRGFFDDLFGISSTTTTPVAATAAVPVATTPVVAIANTPVAAAVTTPVAQVAQSAQVNTVATTTSSSSSEGFWAKLFGGGKETTSATPATAAAVVATPIANTQVTAVTTPAAAAAAAAATTTSKSGGFIANLIGDLLGDLKKTSSSAAAAAPVAVTTAAAPAATTPLVVTSEIVVTSVVTPVATAAVPVAGATTSSSSGSSDLFAFLFGGSSHGTTSSSSPAGAPAGTQATANSGAANSGSSNPIHGSGQSQGGASSGTTPTTTGSTLGISFQGGGTATTSVNQATVTVSGSAEGAKAAQGAKGITYSPYTDQDNCKSAQQVANDVSLLSSYDIIRLYGTDCSGIENVMAAMGSNQQIYIGVWNIDSPQGELQDIVNAVSSSSRGWSAVHTIAIGNERVNAGEATVAQVKSAVDTSRTYLTSNGYTGPIVTVDTLVAYIGNPELCQISDYLAVNCHPYWDGNVAPGDSGPWLLQQISSLQSVCGTSKDVLITESGWPTEGEAYGSCVPSVENQVSAVSSIVSSLADKVIMFTMYNDYWKFSIGGAGPYGVEYYWGLYGNSPE